MSQTVSNPKPSGDPKQNGWLQDVLGLDPASYGSPGDAAPGDPTPGDPTMDKAAAKGAASDKPTEIDTAMLPKLRKAIGSTQWAEAAGVLEVLSKSVCAAEVKKLKPVIVKFIHKAAIKEYGVSSPSALATAALDHPVLGGDQAQRASALEKSLSPDDKKVYDEVMAAAKTPAEKSYIGKGLAAGHSVAELKKFQAKIAGKDAKWLQDNLSLTGNSKGKGVKQQWSMSCNATAAEAVKGEMDPLYALQMHEDNPKLTEADDKSGTKLNPKMAAEQKAWLESQYPDGSKGGDARARGDRAPATGRWNTDLLNNQKGATGLDYQRELFKDDKEMEKGVKDMNDALDKKMPVPIIVGDGGKNKNAHYVVITATDPGPPRYYSIHDPATGDTVVRSEEQLKKGNLDMGWNKIAGIEKPTAVPIKGNKVK